MSAQPLTAEERKRIAALPSQIYEYEQKAGAGNPEGAAAKSGENPKTTQRRDEFEATRASYMQKLSQLRAEYESLKARAPPEVRQEIERGGIRTEFEARGIAIETFGGNITTGEMSASPEERRTQENLRNLASYYPAATREQLFSFYKGNISETELSKLDAERMERLTGQTTAPKPAVGFSRKPGPPANVQINYGTTLALAQESGIHMPISSNLPESFAKDQQKQFERLDPRKNYLLNLREGPGQTTQTDYLLNLYEGPSPKQNVNYTISLTEGPAQIEPKAHAVSLTEGVAPKPRELTQEQVNKLSETEYAVYASEFDAYNKFQKEQYRKEKLAAWHEYRGDLLSDIREAKEKGVKLIIIKSDAGFKTVPIDSAFVEVVKTKNVSGISAVPEIPKGYTVTGTLQNQVFFPVETKYGPDEAYTGMFKDPRKGREFDLGRDILSTDKIYTAAAKLGISFMGGVAVLLKGTKAAANIFTGNQTAPEIPSAPTATPNVPVTQAFPTRTVGAISGGGVSITERNVGVLRQSLDEIVKATSSRETKGENAFLFALKEQKPRGIFENIRDVGEGFASGFTRTSVLLTATMPEAFIDMIKTGDFSERVGEERLQKDEESLRKLGIGPSAPAAILEGKGTGRSPYYNVAETIGEIGPGLQGLKKLIVKPTGRLSSTGKAEVLTKAEAAREKNIYGVEGLTEKPQGSFISKKIESLRARLRQPEQFIGSIGMESETAGFDPLSKGVKPGAPKVTPKGPSVTGIGPKGEKITYGKPEIVEPVKGKPSETPALIIDTGEGGLTGIVKAQPGGKLENQIGVIMRGDVAPATARKFGLKQISPATENKLPVFAARLPKGAKKREKFLAGLEEAEKIGLIKRVTDIEFIPTERALGIATGKIGGGKFLRELEGDTNKPIKKEKSKGRTDIRFGERKESYGPREIRNEFQTAPYYETKQSYAQTPREVRGAKTGKKTPDLSKSVSKLSIEEQLKLSKEYESEFGSSSYDRYLKELGMSSGLEPQAATKKSRSYVSNFKKEVGTGGSVGKAQAITKEKALDIAASISPLTQGVKSQPVLTPSYGIATGTAYSFETEVTGKYTVRPPMTEPKLDIYTRNIFDTKPRLETGLKQRDILSESSKQVQPELTQEIVRTDTITKAGLKEQQKQKEILMERVRLREFERQVPLEGLRVEPVQGLKQKLLITPKLDIPLIPKVPEELKPRVPKTPTFRVPEIEKRKEKREKEEKQKQEFFGNVPQEKITGVYRKYDIKYGKPAGRAASIDITKGRRERTPFVEPRSESFLSKKQNMFTEKKSRRGGFGKPSKRYRF